MMLAADSLIVDSLQIAFVQGDMPETVLVHGWVHVDAGCHARR